MQVNYYLPVGSILKVDLKLNADHSGIYLGYGNVAELDGSGKIMVRHLDDFLKGDRSWRCGQKIYAAYDSRNRKFLAEDQIALRAIESLCQIRDYDVTKENCHKFSTGCITGNFDNDVTFLNDLEGNVIKHFCLRKTEFEWRQLGLFYLQPNKLKTLEDFKCRERILGKEFSSRVTIFENFCTWHDFIDEPYSNPEVCGRMLIYLVECMQQGFPNIGDDVRRFLYKSIPDFIQQNILPEVKSTLKSILSYAEHTSYEELMRVRDIERLFLLMARADILLNSPEKFYSSSKMKEFVNSFGLDKSICEFMVFLEDELECKEELPAEAFVSMDDTVSGLYDAMRQHLPSDIFNTIFSWNDPVFK